MFLRALVITLALFMGIGVYLPLASNVAEASAEKPNKNRKNRKKYKKYSKKWWRAHNKRVRHRRAINARRRALRLRRIRLANALRNSKNGTANQSFRAKSNPNRKRSISKNVKRSLDSPKDLQFRGGSGNAANSGAASVTVVGAAMGADDNPRSKTIGGVPVNSLRRMVIDQMVREEGWVVNDYQKEVGGKKVYFVVAYSPGVVGMTQSRLFYFTEADNRIYRVASSAPEKNLKFLEMEAEKMVNSIRYKSGNVQQAELK